MKIDALQWAKLGAGFGIMTTIVFWLWGLLKLSIIQIPFATLQVERTGLAADFAKYLYGFTGLAEFSFMGLIYTVIGGALFVLLGALIYNMLNLPMKTPTTKLTAVLVIASFAAGFIMSWSVSIPAMGTIITLLISSFAFSWVAINLFRARVPLR